MSKLKEAISFNPFQYPLSGQERKLLRQQFETYLLPHWQGQQADKEIIQYFDRLLMDCSDNRERAEILHAYLQRQSDPHDEKAFARAQKLFELSKKFPLDVAKILTRSPFLTTRGSGA